MTREEMKALDYLYILSVEPDHEVTRLELKNKFLELSEKYKSDEETKYFKVKQAYDYLYDHMELLNEAIHNKLTPYAETHNYSLAYGYDEEIKPKEEAKEENTAPSSELARTPMPEIKDRPTLFAAVLSLLFFFRRRAKRYKSEE